MVKWLPRDPVRRGAVLVAFLAVSSVYFVYTYVYAPRAERRVTQETRLRRLDERNAEAAARIVEGRLLERRVSNYIKQLARLETLLPSNLQISVLLESLSEAEGGPSVEIIRMRPEPIQQGPFYDLWSYEMEVQGGYHSIASFLTDVASLERILVPDVVTIVPAATVPGHHGPHNGNVTAHLRITTYVVRPDPRNTLRDSTTASEEDDA